ncbi:UMP kinase [Natronomonas sp. EA1]|uniref:UMP kinase n=1 Tax=Natronomonas sp. EA1 TaxID=3421655 RepID=UPI003EBCB12F
MRIVVSVGGSVLAPTLGENRVEEYAAVVEGLVADGHDVAAVVGGGGVAREYIGAARELGANEIELDGLGIAVTRLNARLLKSALSPELVGPTIPENYDEAAEALHRGDVAVMGGIVPGQTTDTVTAALAEYVEADLLIYATSVNGVYTADPNEDPDAEHFTELTAGELVEIISTLEMAAGSNAPVDLLAAKLIQRAGMHAYVIDGTDPQRVARAVEGDHDGTAVVPE